MAKLTDLRDRFSTAVTNHATLRTFWSGIVDDIDRLLRQEYPILVLEPPEESTVTNYRSLPYEEYSIRFWILMQKKQADTKDNVWEKLEQMKDYGYDVLDSVISRSTLPLAYNISSDVAITNHHFALTSGTIGVEFSLSLTLTDCRNMS